MRFITNNASRLAALLSGDVDAIEGVPTTDLDNVKKNPKLVFAQKESARLVYFYIDSGRADTPQVDGKNGEQTGKKSARGRARAPRDFARHQPRGDREAA